MSLLTLSMLAAIPLFTDPLAAVAANSKDGEVWAGHQVSFGKREVPFKGEVQTRTDTWTIARVRQEDDRLTLTQEACMVVIKPVAGVKVRMDARALPSNAFDFSSNGVDLKGSSLVKWADEDVDGDGNPGMTVHVDSPVCSGDLYVSNKSKTSARASLEDGALRGKARVNVEQQVLGAKGACLSVVASDTREVVTGPFAYAPVAAGATCRSLFQSGWPVDATE
ncbi:MAG: hypothetical protein AAGA54_25475 [Myxococcota bacterium]